MLIPLASIAVNAVVPGKEWAVAAVVALTPVIIQIIDWAATYYETAIPAWVKPIAASVLGAALTYFGGFTSGDPLVLALVGLAVAGIRQVLVHIGRAGVGWANQR